MDINIISENNRTILIDYLNGSTTSINSNSIETIPDTNMILNLQTSVSHFSINNLFSSIESSIGDTVFILVFLILLIISYTVIGLLKKWKE